LTLGRFGTKQTVRRSAKAGQSKNLELNASPRISGNPPQCHLGLLQKTLHPSKGNIWLSSTLTRVCSDGLPPKPIWSDTSASAPLRFTKWCSRSNERGWFDDSLESLAASKCWLLPSCSRSYVDSISTDQNRYETCRRLNIPIRDYLGSVLPGLADRPISQTTELTPPLGLTENDRPSRRRRQSCSLLAGYLLLGSFPDIQSGSRPERHGRSSPLQFVTRDNKGTFLIGSNPVR